MLRMVVLFLSLLLWFGGPALSKTYYVAPLDTKIRGPSDGTKGLPFLSIEAAFKSGKVKGGDTLLLLDGAYGPVTVKSNAVFDAPVTIMSQNGKAAQFDSILLAGNTRNLVLRNLSVWPQDPSTGSAYLVRAYRTTSDITVDGLDVRSEKDAANYMQWDAAKWEARKFSGILLEGVRNLVTQSEVIGVYHGIVVGEYSKITDNIVDGFNGDGLRAFSNTTVSGNQVVNCVKTNDNHDDGFQSFAKKGESITNLVLDGNTIVEWAGAVDHPLRCKLQGIGLFDGPYVNLTIVNNVVSVSHSHGISVYGAKGATISNNTVVNNLGLTGGVPYIAVRPLKGGAPSTNVVVSDNLAMGFHVNVSIKDRIESRGNSVIGTPSRLFENPAIFDYRTKTLDEFAPESVFDKAESAVVPPMDDTPVAPVPLPGGGLLLVGALGGLAVLRRKSLVHS